jgi:hypothetical protein
MPFARSAGPILLAGFLVPASLAAVLALGPGTAGGARVEPLAFALLALWAALVAADERALGPLVFREPLVAAGVSGLILGRPHEGLLVGALVQWVWPGLRPIGGSREPAAGLAALVTLGWFVLTPAQWGDWRLAVAMGGGMLAASLGPGIERWMRKRNEMRESLLLRDLQSASQASRVVLSGLAEAGGAGALACALWVGAPALILAWCGAGSARSLAPAAALESAWSWRGLVGGAWGAGGAVVLAGLMFAAGGCARDGHDAWKGEWGRLRDASRSRGRAPIDTGDDAGSRPGHNGRRMRLEPRARVRPDWRRLVRLLLIQAGYSVRFQQRCGFLWVMQATRRAGSKDPEPAENARPGFAASMLTERSPNTQPLMAAALAGALDRVLDEPGASTSAGRPPARLMQLGGGLLAQWGDRVIWGGVRPFVALVVLIAAAVVSAWGSVLIWIGLALVLEPLARARLYAWGWSRGWAIVPFRPAGFWRGAERWMAPARLPLGVLGAILLLLARVRWPVAGGEWVAPVALFVVGFALGGGATRRPLLWGWMSAAAVGGAALCAALL